MSEIDSPFRSPVADTLAELDDQRIAIYRVGLYRQWVGWAFVGSLISQFSGLVLASMWNHMYHSWNIPTWAWTVYILAYLAAMVSHAGFLILSLLGTFLLTRALANRYVATATALVMLVPGVSLFVLFVINELGNRHLRKHGIVVGTFGASARSVFCQLQAELLDTP